MNCNNYWKQVIHEIETAAYLKTRNEKIRNIDFSATLPEGLRKRVAKILPYGFEEYDRNVYIDESSTETRKSQEKDVEDTDEDSMKKDRKKMDIYNESTCSEIERMEVEFPVFELKLDTPTAHKSKHKKSINWCSAFICRPRKERVQWESKIYQFENNIFEKTLDEQAEQLMDASAERFTDWINNLGSNHQSDISKEKLKALFSIEGDRNLLSSIKTEPKEVKAIAKTVADKWNLPEMAIELKYEKYIKNRLHNVPRKVETVAFGRTIPYKMRPWVPSSTDSPITTVFPTELLTGEKLFKGITHLRSTKALVDFCRHHPVIEKPPYLVKHGMFKHRTKRTAKMEIPLYEKLKLKY